MQSLPRVLLVEDDRSIAGALAHALQNTYEIDLANTGKLAIYKTDSEQYEVIILDLNLPDMSGVAVCQTLRERGAKMPILILSGESSVLTKINLLDAGANDYLSKPFSLGELKARLRALIRNNHQPSTQSPQLAVGGLILDRQNHMVSREGVDIQLRRKEFALLEYLMEHAGVLVTREAITRSIWPGTGAMWTNTVDVHIKHLRDKVDKPFGKSLIITVHGLGYKILAERALPVGKN